MELRLIREHNERASLAWYTAMLSRTTKRVTLRSLMARTRRSLDEQMVGLIRWVQATGGKVIRRDENG